MASFFYGKIRYDYAQFTTILCRPQLHLLHRTNGLFSLDSWRWPTDSPGDGPHIVGDA